MESTDKKAEGAYFVRAEPSLEKAWIGQQIVLDYKLYTSVDVESYNIIEEAPYRGFYAEDMRRIDGRVMRELIEGEEYATKVLKRVALFPQRAGMLEIRPMQLQLGITEGSARSRGFFFNRQVRRVPLSTDVSTIEVASLPPGAPATFSGAVGTFSIRSSIDKTNLSTEDALTLRLVVTGDGDIKRVQAPPLDLPESFELYEPAVAEESTYESAGRLMGRKIFEYIILPGEAGSYSLRPEFSYFDPDSARYLSLSDRTYRVNVQPGLRGERPTVSPADTVQQPDIRHIKLDSRLKRKDDRFSCLYYSIWLAGIPLLAFAGVWIFKFVKRRQGQVDPRILRRRRARKQALSRLKTARKLKRENKARDFYDEVSRALLGYAGDRLQLPVSELNKPAMRRQLESAGVEKKNIDQFEQLLQTCESALFAGRDRTSEMETTYHTAVDLISSIETEIKKKAV